MIEEERAIAIEYILEECYHNTFYPDIKVGEGYYHDIENKENTNNYNETSHTIIYDIEKRILGRRSNPDDEVILGEIGLIDSEKMIFTMKKMKFI